MAIYKVKDTWYIDLYADGRRRRKAVGSRKDAENALAAVRADILRGEYRFKKESRIRFEDFTEKYLEYGKINKKRSWERDRSSIKNMNLHFGGMLFSKIAPLHIEEYKKTLPMGRLGEPEEIGNFIKSIVENNIKYLSGVTINFDGANSNYIF